MPDEKRGARVGVRISLLLAVLTGVAILVSGVASGALTPDAVAAARGNGDAQSEIDLLENLVDRQALLADIAGLCGERATHAELRDWCTSAQSAFADQAHRARGWLQDWYGIDYAAPQQDLSRLEGLDGDTFEQEILRSLILNSVAAVNSGEQCSRDAQHAELAHLCAQLANAHLDSVRQLLGNLCDWYGICHDQPPDHTQPQYEFDIWDA